MMKYGRYPVLVSSYSLNNTYRTLSILNMEMPSLHECYYPKSNCKNRLKNGCANEQCVVRIDRCWEKVSTDRRNWDINLIEIKEIKIKKKKSSKKKNNICIIVKNVKHKCEYCDKISQKNIIHSNGSQDSKIHYFCSMNCKKNWIYKIHEKVK